MLKQIYFYIVLASITFSTGFTPMKVEEWKAAIILEGLEKPILLESSSIYGGYNVVEKKFFFFGKNHMFLSKTDPESTKIFDDLCVTNASGQFQFEINNITDVAKSQSVVGNVSFKKKFPVKALYQINKSNVKVITYTGDFQSLGIELTTEAKKITTGKFTLKITSIN